MQTLTNPNPPWLHPWIQHYINGIQNFSLDNLNHQEPVCKMFGIIQLPSIQAFIIINSGSNQSNIWQSSPKSWNLELYFKHLQRRIIKINPMHDGNYNTL